LLADAADARPSSLQVNGPRVLSDRTPQAGS
jgi:hypothetical protein